MEKLNGKEKLNRKESFACGILVAELYADCDSRTQEALVMSFLEVMKENDFKRWKRIMDKSILE